MNIGSVCGFWVYLQSFSLFARLLEWTFESFGGLFRPLPINFIARGFSCSNHASESTSEH